MDHSLLAATVGALCVGLAVLLIARHRSRRPTGMTPPETPREIDVTLVACGLDGFAEYAEAVPSRAVVALLAEYHEAVGKVAAQFGGTVGECAGEEIEVLLGAPLPLADHARAGLTLAVRIREVTLPVIERWSTGPHPIGIRVGLAAGRVTLGESGSEPGALARLRTEAAVLVAATA